MISPVCITVRGSLPEVFHEKVLLKYIQNSQKIPVPEFVF